MKRAKLRAVRGRVTAAAVAIGASAVVLLIASHPPDGSVDLSVPTTLVAVAARQDPPPVVPADESTPTAPATATATATAESHVVIEAPASSGRVVVTNNGTATANTGANTGQNIVTGPATAIASDSVVIVK